LWGLARSRTSLPAFWTNVARTSQGNRSNRNCVVHPRLRPISYVVSGSCRISTSSFLQGTHHVWAPVFGPAPMARRTAVVAAHRGPRGSVGITPLEMPLAFEGNDGCARLRRGWLAG